MTLYDQISSNKRRTWAFVLGFALIIVALGYAIGLATDMGFGPLAIAGFIAIFGGIGGYYYSDKIILTISGTTEIKPESNKELYRLVENLCIGTGLPTPKIYIIDDTAPNAFATGRDPQHAVIAVTSGLLTKLERAELEGVLAHELSHLGNYDTRLMMVVTALAGMVMIMTDLVWRIHFFGGGGSNNKNSDKARLVVLILAVILIIFEGSAGSNVAIPKRSGSDTSFKKISAPA